MKHDLKNDLSESCSRSPRKRSAWIPARLFLLCIIGWVACTETGTTKTISTQPPRIEAILLDIVSPFRNHDELKAVARNLLHLAQGERFSDQDLQQSIKALKQSGLFESIDVQATPSPQPMRLTFHLQPFQRIKNIRISGAHPLFEKEVLKVMTLRTGDIFSKKTVAQQTAPISELYRREGFTDPHIQLTHQTDPDDGHVVVQISIDRGPFCKLEKFTITINGQPPQTSLQSRLKTWHQSRFPGMMGRFRTPHLKADINTLIQYFREKGFPEVTLQHHIEPLNDSDKLHLHMALRTGPEYDIQFLGNQHARTSTLKKYLTIFQKGNANNFELRRNIRAIKDHYEKNGYLNTRVTMETETKTVDGKEYRNIFIHIEEGPRTMVSGLVIKGNHRFDEQKIKKQMLTRINGIAGKTPFIPDQLDEDLNAVQLLYFTHGFRQTVIKKDIQQNPENTVFITIQIAEGPQTIISDIQIEGLTAIPLQKALSTFKLQPGTPFRSYMLKSDRNELSALIAEQGYPHVNIETEVSCTQHPSKVHLIYKVRQGPLVRFGPILITGNFRTRKAIIEKELTIQPDTLFSLQAVLKSQQKLRDLAIFNTVSIIPLGLQETRKTVPLVVNVAERKPYVIEVEAGFENYTGLFGQARISDRNLLGCNKNGWIEAGISQTGYRIESGLENPRLFGTPVTAAFSVYAERREELNQNFGTRSFGGAMGLSRELDRRLSFGLNVELEQRDTFASDHSDGNLTLDEADLIAEEARTIMVISPFIQYDTRDSFVRPRQGIFSLASMDISKGFSLKGDNFIRYELDNRFFVTPYPRLTLACLLRAGYIEAFGASKKIPSDQRFFLGGATSVRGFEENLLQFDSNGDPKGGCSSIAGSLEARVDLGNHFEMVLFYDVGRLGDHFQDLYSGDFRDACGLGLHYLTPVGPIGLSYGYNLDRMEEESRGEWYLSVGYTF